MRAGLVLCLFKEAGGHGRERERARDKVEFTQKAVSDSYIGHDCLIAVSMVMLLMVGEQ